MEQDSYKQDDSEQSSEVSHGTHYSQSPSERLHQHMYEHSGHHRITDDGHEREQDTIVEDRIFAAMSYISILFVVPLILKNENEDIHFHARQGLVLFGAELAVWFVLSILLDSFLRVLFPHTDLGIVRILGAVAWIGFVAVSLMGIYAASRTKRWNIPVIGRLAARIKF